MPDRPIDPRAITRRHFYRDCGIGIGKIALASLLSGAVPDNPDDPGDAHLRISLSVSPDGIPQNFHVIESTSPHWADDALREMRSWRFRPADRGGPVEVQGVFEIVRPGRVMSRSQPD